VYLYVFLIASASLLKFLRGIPPTQLLKIYIQFYITSFTCAWISLGAFIFVYMELLCCSLKFEYMLVDEKKIKILMLTRLQAFRYWARDRVSVW
jgi:hypothetical protein